MDCREDRDNAKKSGKEKDARASKKLHKRSLSQDMRPSRLNPTQVNGHHHHHHHHQPGLSTQALKPRITKLENLEARMASIEVSLSNALEHCSSTTAATRGKATSGGSGNTSALCEQQQQIVEVAEKMNISHKNSNIPNLIEEIEKLRKRLYEKEAVITSLREQTSHILASSNQPDLTSTVNFNVRNQALIQNWHQNANWLTDLVSLDSQTIEECIRQVQLQIDDKTTVVKNLKLKLENFEVNDLDSRIHQAELECLLEKEEMNILNLHQEQVNLKGALNQLSVTNGNHVPQLPNLDDMTLFSIVNGGHCTSLIAVEVHYETQAPCFYVTAHHSGKGLIVQWAKDSSKMKKGDRLLEVNGQLVVHFGKEEFLEVLRCSSANILRIVTLRNSPMLPLRKVNSKEVESLKDEISSVVNKLDTKIKENKELLLSVQKLQKELQTLKDDNQKLQHRTFYLEDQLTEALQQPSISARTLTPQEKNAQQTSILPSESNICSSVTTIADRGRIVENTKCALTVPRPTSSCLSGSNATCHMTKVQHSSSSTSLYQYGLHRNSVAKSHSTNQLDKMLVPAVNSNKDHHVLQVKIPFLPMEKNLIARALSSYDVRTSASSRTTSSAYVNVPLSSTFSLPLHKDINSNPSQPAVWTHNRNSITTGADSDSGNYSADSMDDCHLATDSTISSYLLQRLQQKQVKSVTAVAATGTCGNNVSGTVPSQPLSNHCYVNLMESRMKLDIQRSNCEVAKSERNSEGCKSIKTAAITNCTTSKQLLQTTTIDKSRIKNGPAKMSGSLPLQRPCGLSRQVAGDHRAVLQLKMDCGKIQLGDEESDKEEWC